MATHIQATRTTLPKGTKTEGEKQYFPNAKARAKNKAGPAASADTFESSAKSATNPLYVPAGKSGENP